MYGAFLIIIELLLCKFAGHGAWIFSFSNRKDLGVDIELDSLLDRSNIFNILTFGLKLINIIVCFSYLVITYSKYVDFRQFLKKIIVD